MTVVEDRWTAIYREHSRYIFRVIHARVPNRADAEDLTAEVFSRAVHPLRASAGDAQVRAYLIATAHSVLADYWKQNARLPVTALRDDMRPPDRTEASTVNAEDVRAILAGLPPRYRQILELRFLQALTLQEAADKLGITIGNAKVLQHRALTKAARVASPYHPVVSTRVVA